MNPFLIIAALLILYSLKNYKQGFFSLSGVPAVPKQQHKPDKPSGRSVIDPGSIHVDLLRTAICNQKKKIQPGNNDISPAVQQGIYLGTIVLCSIELYFDRRNPEYLHVTAIRCFLRFHQCLFMLDVNIKQRRYTESCQYIIRSLADNLHICIYRKIPGLQSRNGL
ncbi:MAG: hypothetical protein ACLUFW_04010 [Alistipes sp.]